MGVAGQGTILVVDDDPDIRNLLERLLGAQGHVVVAAGDGHQAMALIEAERPDLLVLDVMMPDVDGLALCRRLREDDATRPLPIILMTASCEIEDIWRGSGADAVIRKPFDRGDLLSWVQCLLRTGQVRENLERAEAMLVDVAAAIEARSLCPEHHPRRVARHSVRIAATASLNDAATAIIRKAALLHDIGNIGVPDGILRKPGPLTPEEFEQMKRHTILGAHLCRSLPDGAEISAIVRGHHEHWDGKGYPDGLAGAGIPLGARIVAIADAFDVLATDRPHRQAVSPREALEVLWSGADSQWDPHLVELFDRIVRPTLGDTDIEDAHLHHASAHFPLFNLETSPGGRMV